MTKSCHTCAWSLRNVSRDTGHDFIATSTPRINVCLAYNTALGAFYPEDDGAMSEDDAQTVAGRCAEYLEATDESRSLVSAAMDESPPEPGAVGKIGGPIHLTLPLTVAHGRAPSSVRPDCGRCIYYCKPEELTPNGLPTLSKQGRGAGMCVAKGTLQSNMPGARRTRAAGCQSFTVPHGDDVEAGGQAMAEYRTELLASAGFLPHLAPLLADSVVGEHSATDDEAGAATAEREPTDDERSEGIVRFHRFHSDDKRYWIDMPVFDPASFDEAERGKIPVAGCEGSPEVYVDHANLGYRVAVAWALGETPALNGPAGTGKTALFQWMAYLLGLPFERVSITASSSTDDLAGYMELHGQQTEFVLGRIPKAWGRRCVMVIDEPNAGPPEVWQFIRPITDSAKQLVIDANHGQTIRRHRYSFLGMAMNPAWDWRNTGVSQLSDADGSRLLHIAVGYPPAPAEREIILGHCADDGIDLATAHLDALIEVAHKLRKLSDEQTLQISWGIRQQVQVARLLPYFDFVDAFRMAAADNLEPEQSDLILSEVNLATAKMSRKTKTTRKGR